MSGPRHIYFVPFLISVSSALTFVVDWLCESCYGTQYNQQTVGAGDYFASVYYNMVYSLCTHTAPSAQVSHLCSQTTS